jgi:hypothetical protein
VGLTPGLLRAGADLTWSRSEMPAHVNLSLGRESHPTSAVPTSVTEFVQNRNHIYALT